MNSMNPVRGNRYSAAQMKAWVLLLFFCIVGCDRPAPKISLRTPDHPFLTDSGTSQPPTLSDVNSLTLVSYAYYFDGGTTTLYAVTDAGAKCTISLVQHMMRQYEDDGRLYFNTDLVEVRSTDESAIIDLLKTASVDLIDLPDADSRNQVPDLILGDDIKNSVTSSAEDNINKFRDKIISFVESDEYVRISQQGR